MSMRMEITARVPLRLPAEAAVSVLWVPLPGEAAASVLWVSLPGEAAVSLLWVPLCLPRLQRAC